MSTSESFNKGSSRKSKSPYFEAKNITKRFVNVTALDRVNFDLVPGEIHGLIGENGAGKSTLINVLCGVCEPDEGELIFNGKPIKIIDPAKAVEMGITVVHQDICIIPHLSVAENIFLDNFPRKKMGFIDWKRMYRESKKEIEKLGFSDINIKKPINRLSTGQQKIVQIAAALTQNRDIKVLILDEPSAILTPLEVKKLFIILNKIKNIGIMVVYISHYLEEVLEIADRITILKDGKIVTTLKNQEVKKDRLVNLMTGKEILELYKHTKVSTDEEVLSVENLNGDDYEDISFTLHKGEILGIVGLVGSGRIGIARTIFGLRKQKKGEIFLNRKKLNIKHPREAIKLGIGLLPEDRRKQGLVIGMMIKENMTMSSMNKVNKLGILKKKKENEFVKVTKDKLRIKAPNIQEKVINLSGGNQQKVSFAKWLFSESNILILEEPTSGVDIGAKDEIYNLMKEFVEQGKSIILISSDISEILRNSDNMLVINKGKITARFTRDKATESKILSRLV